jgi:hypothetical protein
MLPNQKPEWVTELILDTVTAATGPTASTAST